MRGEAPRGSSPAGAGGSWADAGELVTCDDRTLKVVDRISGSWLRAPTGTFDVNDTAREIY